MPLGFKFSFLYVITVSIWPQWYSFPDAWNTLAKWSCWWHRRNFKSDGMEEPGSYLGHIMELTVFIHVHSHKMIIQCRYCIFPYLPNTVSLEIRCKLSEYWVVSTMCIHKLVGQMSWSVASEPLPLFTCSKFTQGYSPTCKKIYCPGRVHTFTSKWSVHTLFIAYGSLPAFFVVW